MDKLVKIIKRKENFEDNKFEGTFEDFSHISDYVIDFTNNCEIIYEGEYKNGMKCGKGKEYLTGYEGEFLYGMYHGKGKKIILKENIKMAKKQDIGKKVILKENIRMD